MRADLRLAIRLLRHQPGYAAIVILTLGFGIGGVAAVFTLADPMIFRPLPYAEADRIVEVRAQVKDTVSQRLHADDFVAIASQARTLDAAATLEGPYLGSFRGSADPVLGGGVSANFLRLTGLSPVLGRVFRPEEYERDRSQLPTVAMITWGFWRQAFGANPDVVGQRLDLGGPQSLSMEIVGVLPREFFYPETANQAPVFIVPGRLDPRYLGRANIYPTILARVRPESTFAQAEAELQPLLAGVEHANPTFEQGRRPRLIKLQELLFSSLRTPLLLLFIATGCVLMLAWVNLSHLAQAHARARARDVAVRLALGAGRWRILRQGMVEAGVLCALGSAAGLAIGSGLFTWGMSRTPRFSHLYRLMPAGLSARVVLVTLGLAVLGMLAVGAWPAWRAARRDLRATLDVWTGRVRGWRLGGESLAIAGQAALAVGLVVTCLLVVRSFIAVATADRGFDPARVELARLAMPGGGEPAATAFRYRRLVDEISRVPGVDAVAAGNGVPALTLPEAPVDTAGAPVRNITAFQVSGRFPDAMGMRLEEGRLFDDAEGFAAMPVAVVDRTAATLMWPGESSLGQTVRLRGGRTFQVVGVLAQVGTDFYSPETRRGTVFVSIDSTANAVVSRLMVVVRVNPSRPPTDGDLAAAAKRADPGIGWNGMAGMSSWERLIGQPRFLASSLGVLAALTALLAGFGVFGVVSHLVSRRTREIGIRMALGADRARVRRLVVRQAVVPAVIGVGAGLLLAFWWSASVRSVLTGIGPHDPWSFAVAALATVLTVAVATLEPAIRASRLDPARTLRAE
jgi:putative ABC transport system permease protein